MEAGFDMDMNSIITSLKIAFYFYKMMTCGIGIGRI